MFIDVHLCFYMLSRQVTYLESSRCSSTSINIYKHEKCFLGFSPVFFCFFRWRKQLVEFTLLNPNHQHLTPITHHLQFPNLSHEDNRIRLAFAYREEERTVYGEWERPNRDVTTIERLIVRINGVCTLLGYLKEGELLEL